MPAFPGGGGDAVDFCDQLLAAPRTVIGRASELEWIETAWRERRGLIALQGGVGLGKTALARSAEKRLAQAEAPPRFYWSVGARRGEARRLLDALDRFLTGLAATRPEVGEAGEGIGRRLGVALRKTPAFVVLDGLEALQHPPHVRSGRIKHAGLAALLTTLRAAGPVPGGALVLAIGRQRVEEARPDRRLLLAGLAPEHGAALLAAEGLAGASEDLRAASADMEGCPLALLRLAKRLRAPGSAGGKTGGGTACGTAQVVQRDRLALGSLLAEGAEAAIDLEARRAAAALRRELERVERLPRRAAGRGAPERAVLSLASLKPAGLGPAELEALLAAPAIPGVTEALAEAPPRARAARLDFAARRLRAMGLLAPAEAGAGEERFSVPLLARLAARARLAASAPAGLAIAERRLFALMKSRAPSHPSDRAEMAPLLSAMPHGAAGAERPGALSKLFRAQFWDRALRGESRFALSRLGAFRETGAALAGFFEAPWERPDPRLEPLDQARAQALAGFLLKGLARLPEALSALAAAADRYRRLGRLEDAARAETERLETLILMGRAEQVSAAAEEALDLAESLPPYSDRRVTALSAAAEAARLAGASPLEARRLRRAAQAQARRAEAGLSDRARLYSLAGRRAALAFLREGRLFEARSAADFIEAAARRDGLPLGLGLARLTQAEIAAAEVETAPREAIPAAREGFDQALTHFETAGRRDAAPEALLARGRFLASLAARRGGAADAAAAERDLEQARLLADLAGMTPAAETARRALATLADGQRSSVA